MLARLPSRVVVEPGSSVHLRTEEPIHLFESASGKRIESTVMTKETVSA
jgi:hypothetical protein